MSAYVGERRSTRMSLPRSERGAWGGVARSERPSGKTARVGLRGLELALFAAIVAALGVFHVWSRTRVVEAGYDLGKLQEEHARLVAAQDGLKLEIGMLTSAQALDHAARGKLARLGLAPPDRGAVWAASPDRALGDPGRAGGLGVDHPPRPAGPIPEKAGFARRRGEGEARALLGMADPAQPDPSRGP